MKAETDKAAVILRERMLLQAIITRYHGPTNTRGSRISATAAAGRVYVERDSALSIDDNHGRAALALCAKMGWDWPLYGGGHPDGRGNVYVQVEPSALKG